MARAVLVLRGYDSMNYKKYHSDIISEIQKSDDQKVMFDEMEDTNYVGVVTCGFYGYVFPRESFLLDKSKMKNTNIIKITYLREAYAEDLLYAGTSPTTKNGKFIDAVELRTKDHKTIYLDEKYVKKFGKPGKLTYKSEGAKKIVFVYDSGVLVGVIMPFICREGNNDKD